MRTWYEIYSEEILKYAGVQQYISDKIRNKKAMIDIILEHAEPGERILEAGCGTGIISTYLCEKGLDVMGVDIDENILNLASNLASNYSKCNVPQFIRKSILNLDYPSQYFKVTFSSGVLEHFEDEQILLSLKQQLYISKFVVVSVPTNYFKDSEAMHGDERFMSIEKWRNLIDNSSGKILKEARCHYLGFPYHYFMPGKLFKPWPYRVFLISCKK